MISIILLSPTKKESRDLRIAFWNRANGKAKLEQMVEHWISY